MIIDLEAYKVGSMKISLNYTQFTLPQNSWKTRKLKKYYEYAGAWQECTIKWNKQFSYFAYLKETYYENSSNGEQSIP